MMGGMSGKVATVVVVDDLPAFRRAMVAVVEAADGFVLAGQATSGEEALAFLEQRHVSLVLMDVVMPGMGGVAAAEAIRVNFPESVVILLSAYDDDVLPAGLRESGAHFQRKDRFGPQELEQLWRAATGPAD